MECKQQVCFRCGEKIQEGGEYYIIDLKVISGFDGIINADPDPEKTREILDSLEEQDPKKLEEDVFRHIKVNLCLQCKNALIKDLTGFDVDTEQSN